MNDSGWPFVWFLLFTATIFVIVYMGTLLVNSQRKLRHQEAVCARWAQAIWQHRTWFGREDVGIDAILDSIEQFATTQRPNEFPSNTGAFQLHQKLSTANLLSHEQVRHRDNTIAHLRLVNADLEKQLEACKQGLIGLSEDLKG